jgi:hypothetical protein
MSDKKFLDVVGFVVQGREQKKRVARVGWAVVNDDGTVRIQLDSIPVGAWDGVLLAQPPRPKNEPPPF